MARCSKFYADNHDQTQPMLTGSLTMKSRRLVDLCAIFFVICSARAEPPTLCNADEDVYFSCETKSKIISLCGSKDATETAGYLVYRYGKAAGSPELEYPRPGSVSPARAFKLSMSNGAKGGTEQLEFNSGEFTYTLHSDHWTTHYPSEYAGVLIEKAGKRVANISCVRPLAPKALYDLGKDEFGPNEKAKPHFVGLPSGAIRCDLSDCY